MITAFKYSNYKSDIENPISEIIKYVSPCFR